MVGELPTPDASTIGCRAGRTRSTYESSQLPFPFEPDDQTLQSQRELL